MPRSISSLNYSIFILRTTPTSLTPAAVETSTFTAFFKIGKGLGLTVRTHGVKDVSVVILWDVDAGLDKAVKCIS